MPAGSGSGKSAAAASETRRLRAVSFYHALLERADVRDYAEGLQEELRRRGVVFGERLLCPFLRPHFITREQFALLARAVRGVLGAISVVAPRITASRELQQWLGLTEEEMRLASIDPGYPDLSVSSRLDSFLLGGKLRFVEYNAECPAGIGYTDVLMDTFLDSQVFRRFLEEFPCRPLFCSDRLLRALLETYARWGGREPPVLAVVDYEGLPTRHEFDILRRFFASRGMRCLVADPRSLVYRNGCLEHQGTRIHLVYRRLLTNEYLERMDECRPVWEAYRDRAICLVNSFRAKYLHKKALFALLTDPAYQVGMTPEQLKAVREHVPWTRRFVPGRTTDDGGQVVDLLGYVREHRRDLVLKPNDEYGGKGIFVGWERTPDQWEQDMERALSAYYLVQRRVDVAREHYPVWDGRQVAVGEYTVDLDPYVFAGECEGLLTRLSASALCNVTAGGGAVPCFVLD